MSEKNPEFNLSCEGIIHYKKIAKMLRKMGEEWDLRFFTGHDHFEKSDYLIERYVEALALDREQPKEKRDDDSWYIEYPEEGIKMVAGFPNPDFLAVYYYNLHARLNKAGRLEIDIQAFENQIEVKKNSKLFGGRVGIKAKRSFSESNYNESMVSESAVEIFEIFELLED